MSVHGVNVSGVTGLEGWKVILRTYGLVRTYGLTKTRNPFRWLAERVLSKKGHRPTLPRITAVPSALAGLTSLFGMGRGGHRRYRHLNILLVSGE